MNLRRLALTAALGIVGVVGLGSGPARAHDEGQGEGFPGGYYPPSRCGSGGCYPQPYPAPCPPPYFPRPCPPPYFPPPYCPGGGYGQGGGYGGQTGGWGGYGGRYGR